MQRTLSRIYQHYVYQLNPIKLFDGMESHLFCFNDLKRNYLLHVIHRILVTILLFNALFSFYEAHQLCIVITDR